VKWINILAKFEREPNIKFRIIGMY